MLTLPGPPPVSYTQHPEEGDLFLRVNQRVAGEVLQVSDDQVVLSIQGVQVVAKLTTPEQVADLMDRRNAQFIVKEINPQNILLQLVKSEPQADKQSPASVLNQQETEFLSDLLKQIGIAPDGTSKQLTQQLIRQGIQVTRETVHELLNALRYFPDAGDAEINLAVQLKSEGVPVTPSTLQLMAKGPAEISGTIHHLIQQLKDLNDLPAGLQDQVSKAIRILSQSILQGDRPASELIQELKHSITLLGKTLEHELLHPTGTGSELEQGLLALTRLRVQLVNEGHIGIAGDIDRLNDYLRVLHLPNAEPVASTPESQWLRMEVPVQYPAGNKISEETAPRPARIKIARETGQDGCDQVDPNYTRIIVQVDLTPGQSIEVDLSVVARQIGLAITASNESVHNAAESELDRLIQDLKTSGYVTKFCHIDQGNIKTEPDSLHVPSFNFLDGNINLEV